MKHRLFAMGFALLSASMLTSFSQNDDSSPSVYYYVTSNTLNVRQSDSASSKKVYTLSKYDVVEYETGQSDEGTWMCVDFRKGNGDFGAGWVSTIYVRNIPEFTKIPAEKLKKEWYLLSDKKEGFLTFNFSNSSVCTAEYSTFIRMLHGRSLDEQESVTLYYINGKLYKDSEGDLTIPYDPATGYLLLGDLLWTCE